MLLNNLHFAGCKGTKIFGFYQENAKIFLSAHKKGCNRMSIAARY